MSAANEQSESQLARPGARKSEPFGVVEGVVTFRGEIPKSSISDDAGVRRDLLEVDGKTRGLRWALVYLAPADGSAFKTTLASVRESQIPPPISPASEPITVDQLDHAFAPRVVAVRAGEPVTFTNSDPANHNVRTSSPVTKNVFNVFTGVGGKYVHRFAAEPELRPIRLGCDIHPWMRGWIYVFDHPHFAVTDEAGRFRIDSVPPGRYKLVLRQPDIGYTNERGVTVLAEQVVRFEVEVPPKVSADP